ncbi:GNAT family N-acetyltransferase [Mangrovibacterium diazotrophicum]|uniref:Putative N-acetyltransferase YhbS n=1 Tax=Mangrovibacterium diazotrophicum TaxID=1261403 RepID=A0A419WBJ4_9BACT|nr:GNAT family N-acetyltransferase [Mangrovibacterium diazotrophicum]RKD92837.1 putative N-acetyltransferase YhbS [Mangrovibacterium diazotrophicum]
MTEIKFEIGSVPDTAQIIEVYNGSGINRPTADFNRIEKMYSNSNLVVSAWKGDELVGIARSLTDFCYACYLSDLAVKREYQKEGIGKRLIELTQQEIGEETALILLSAPAAMGYYPKVGFDKVENGFIIRRTK